MARAIVRREDLVATAARLFREKGYAATSVRDLAEALGVTSAALYNYVDSKEDLLLEIVGHALDIAERRLDRALAGEVPVAERLRRVIHQQTLTALDESQATMAVFFQEIGLARGAGWSALADRATRHQDRIVAVFTAAAGQGVISTPDPRVSAYGVLGMCNWLHRWYRDDGRMTAEQLAEHFTDLALNGLLARPSNGYESVAESSPALGAAYTPAADEAAAKEKRQKKEKNKGKKKGKSRRSD